MSTEKDLHTDFETNYPGRCSGCLMRLEVCICEEIKALANKVKVTLVMHKREARKTTNTGRLAYQSLKNSRILIRGKKGDPLILADNIFKPENCLLLAYSPFSKELQPSMIQKPLEDIELVVPDGSWAHASRMIQRETLFKKMQWVHLPPGPPSRYFLRKEPHPNGVSTLEAIARAMGLIEDQEIQNHLEKIFDLMVERTLQTRPKNRQVENKKSR